jgi:hypothetical protein
VNTDTAAVVTPRLLATLSDALLKYIVGLKLIVVVVLYVTVPSPVTALIAIAPLLFHVLTIHQFVLQFLFPSALSQRLAPVTHPGE